jgi:hypothetical protein
MYQVNYEKVIAKFSTFYRPTYLKDPRLKKNMEELIEKHPEWEENDYVNYFIDILKDINNNQDVSRLAHKHLIAYVSLTGIYVVKKFLLIFPIYKNQDYNCDVIVEDAIYNITNFRQYLYKYNNTRSKFTTYLKGILFNEIKSKFSPESSWRLLCDVEIHNPRKFRNAGQTCICINRLYIHENIILIYLFIMIINTLNKY